MLLFVIESAVPLLTGLLIWAAILGLRGDRLRHRKMAISYFVATFASYALVILLVRLGFTMESKAPEWITDVHTVIIYSLPPILILMLYTGLNSRISTHKILALCYAIGWSAALITGSMIFLLARKLI